MNNNKEEIDEEYIQATLSLYKKITQEERRIRINFRTKILNGLRKDYANGKISNATFTKGLDELSWAMANDDMHLERVEENVIRNLNKDDDKSDGKGDANKQISTNSKIVTFKRRLEVNPPEQNNTNKKRALKTDDIIRMLGAKGARRNGEEK